MELERGEDLQRPTWCLNRKEIATVSRTGSSSPEQIKLAASASCLTSCFYYVLMFCFVPCQELKEKKQVEDKENGKDAATNGKVTPPPRPRVPPGQSLVPVTL